jgi:hypothetical protein
MEIAMSKILLIALLAAAPVAALFAGGCASNNSQEPYGLKGHTRTVDHSDDYLYTDVKGKYHPEMREAGRPVR